MSDLSPRRLPRLLPALLVLQLLIAVVGAYLYSTLTNTLADNERWTVSKLELEKTVFGAHAYRSSRRSLGGDRLDLSRWYGYQQVLSTEALPLQTLACSFRLAENTYIDVLFNATDAGYDGIRLSAHPLFESVAFAAAPSGEFLSVTPLEFGGVSVDRWSRVALTIDDGALRLELDGRAAVSLPWTAAPSQRFGFRGCQGEVLVDDVRAETGGPEPAVWSETFFNGAGFLRGLGLCIAGLLLVDSAALWWLRRRRTLSRRLLHVALAASLGALVVAAAGLWAWLGVLSKAYPAVDTERQEALMNWQTQEVVQRIREQHAPRPAPGTVRVLVVGSSQTWGAGAATEQETFVSVLEQLLNASTPAGTHFECINAGISATRAAGLFELTRDEWVELSPDIIVINLSNNDTDPQEFAAALEAFARLDAERGIRTLFALEANSIERSPEQLALHPVMRRIASEQGVRVVDVHACLKAQSQRGHIWWDFVHVTSFGHRLIAACLAPEVAALAAEAPARR